VKSNHTVGDTILRILKLKLSISETMFLLALIAYIIFLIAMIKV